MSLKEIDRSSEREQMVKRQISGRGISDGRVLKAFLSVNRDAFVPFECQSGAYGDFPLPIGCSQTISQPYMAALMTQALCLKGSEKVLEIGTGSGYQTAILAFLSGKVYTVERELPLQEKARCMLDAEGFTNVEYLCADGSKGWSESAPFDAIIVTAAAPGMPVSLKEQIADNGHIVIPVGSRSTQTLLRLTRQGGEFVSEEICECVFVPLVGEEGWRSDT